MQIVSPSSDSIRLPLVVVAAHDFTNACQTDKTLRNVEVLIENKGDAAVTWQCGGQRVDDRS